MELLTNNRYYVTFLKDAKNSTYEKYMTYLELRTLLGSFTGFSLNDIRQADPSFHRRRLNEWQEKGYIRKVIKGYYVFADVQLNEKSLFEIANRIYAPSYISFEMALAHYGLIPESVYGITSASTRKTMVFKTPLGEFTYRTLRAKLYFGFEYAKANGRNYKIASAEKALLDYFYLNPGINDATGFAAMRVNRAQLLEAVDRRKMDSYLSVYTQQSLKRRTAAFWDYIDYA